jgi:hypothetical protein
VPVTTSQDQTWAHGATPPVTPHTGPPTPPTYFPQTAGGTGGTGGNGPSGRGPRRRSPRWIAGGMVLVAVAAAGAGGWALRGASTTTPAAPTAPASTSPPQPAGALSPEQAKAQTCGAYKVLGLQWSVAFRKWLDALPQPWSWNDPKVNAVTADFDTTETQVAGQLAQLTDPNAPADVVNAVRDVRLKIVELAASHGETATQAETNAKIDQVNAAMSIANKVCGLS